MDQAKTYKWIQDRLRELHSGTLSDQDRARLWSMAEENPFVADALEGYQKHPDPSHTEHLDVLARKIILQKRERRRWLIPNLTVTAVAASLIIIVSTWAVINRMDKKEETIFVSVVPDSLITIDTGYADIAVNDKQNEAAGSDGEEVSSEQLEVSSGVPESRNRVSSKEKYTDLSAKDDKGSATGIELKNSETVVPSYSEASKPQDKIIASEPTAVPSSAADFKAVTEDQPITTATKSATSKLDEGYYANQMDPDLMARRVTGRVIDNTGQPIYGANVIVRNTNLGATTDFNGRFELFLPLPESEVEIYMTGYDESRAVLRQGEEETVVILPPINRSMENAAAGTSSLSKKEKSAAAGAAQLPTSSADETGQFMNYLQKNSKYPLRDNFYSPGNDVSLEFTVPSNGKPEKIKIISSSGKKDLDDEAIRLIRKGPDWTCEGNVYPCVRNYTFYFK